MNETAQQILNIAESLIMQRGFNAFSYADIAKEIGIKTASIHYHFPTKSDLGKSLVDRYHSVFFENLKHVDEANAHPVRKLDAFLDLYLETLDDGQICLCSMLASDIVTLPEAVRLAVKRFFVENEAWLAGVFREGRNDQTLNAGGNAEMNAKHFYSVVQGAMLISRVMNSEERFITLAQDLLNSVSTTRQ